MLTDSCTSCQTQLNEDNTPSPFSVQVLSGFDKPLCVECLLRLDEAELPDAGTFAEDLMNGLRDDISSRYARGVPRERLEETLRLLADRLKREPQTAFTEVDALDDDDE